MISNLLNALSAHTETFCGVVTTQPLDELVGLHADILVVAQVVGFNTSEGLHVNFDWLRRLERWPGGIEQKDILKRWLTYYYKLY